MKEYTIFYIPVFLIELMANWLNVELNHYDNICEFLDHVQLLI
jgi:hypothetical protein